MPTYEYACKSCSQHVEVVQSFHDAPLTTCSSCGGSLRKVFGSIGIAFKGSGFYKTDSRSATTTAKAAKADGKADAKAGAKADGAKADAGGGASTPAASAKGSEPKAASSSESKPAAS